MNKNINTKDRLIRFVIGVILLVIAIWQKSWIASALSIFTFYEALIGWCAFYQLIGKNSCTIDKNIK